MKSLRFYFQVISIFCVLVIFVGCSSKLQQADKMAMSDPNTAIASYEEIIKTNPGTDEAKQAQLKMADTYYKMDQMQKALEIYKQVAKESPKTEFAGEAKKAIGMHYYNAKEYEKAIEEFKKVAEGSPDSDIAKDSTLMVGKSYEALEKNEDAVKVYLDFAKTHPSHRLASQASMTAASIYNDKLNLPDEAIETYKFVASKFPLTSSAREAREALTNMGIDEAEIPTGEGQVQTSEEPQTMAQVGSRTRRRASNVPRPDIGGARSIGDDPQEVKESRTVSKDFGVDPLNLIPDISADSQGTMYDALYMIGITYLQSRQYNEAGALFEKSIELAGDKPWKNGASAYFYLGKSYNGIGNSDKAAEIFKQAIKKDSKIIDKMIREGETQYGEEEYEAALKSYKTALGLVPYKDAEIYYDLGLVYKKLKQPENELDAFERAVARKPSDNDAIQNLAEVLYYRMDDPVRATLYDSEAKGQGNSDYKIQKELGDLCYKYESYSWASTRYNSGIRVVNLKIKDEIEKAIEASADAKKIAEDPSTIDLKVLTESSASGNEAAAKILQDLNEYVDDLYRMIGRRAWAQIKNNQLKGARKFLDEAKTKYPNPESNAEYQYAIAELELAEENKDAGVAALKKALEIDPEHKEAAAKLKELGL